jgi:hypothetical protein
MIDGTARQLSQSPHSLSLLSLRLVRRQDDDESATAGSADVGRAALLLILSTCGGPRGESLSNQYRS